MKAIGFVLAALGTLMFFSFALFVIVWPFLVFGWSGLWLYLLLGVVVGVIYAPFALIDLWFERKGQ